MSQPREARRGQSQRILQEVHLAGHQVDTQSLLYLSGDERKISNHFFERWNMQPIPPKSMEALHGWCANIVTAETSLGALGAGIDIRRRPIEITAETGIDIATKVIEASCSPLVPPLARCASRACQPWYAPSERPSCVKVSKGHSLYSKGPSFAV